MKISLSQKVAIGTFFIAGIGVLLITIVSFDQVKRYVRKNILRSLKFELFENEKQLNKDISDIKKDIRLLINSEQISEIYRATKKQIWL